MATVRKEEKHVTVDFSEDEDDFVFVSGNDCLEHDGEKFIPNDGMNSGTIVSSIRCPSVSQITKKSRSARQSAARRWEEFSDVNQITPQIKSPSSSSSSTLIPESKFSLDEGNKSISQRQPLCSFEEYVSKQPNDQKSLRHRDIDGIHDDEPSKRASAWNLNQPTTTTTTDKHKLKKTNQIDDISRKETKTTGRRIETEDASLYLEDQSNLNLSELTEDITENETLSDDDDYLWYDYELHSYYWLDCLAEDDEFNPYPTNSYIMRRNFEKRYGNRKKGAKYRHNHHY